ncbi:MAG: galactokinase, partial [Ardenticatenia bacterium]|nr:galactokinase [Ardenticatenia bacterium]
MDARAISVNMVLSAFRAHFRRWPTLVVRAPGRVNVIGEHTDYNGGFALPVAIHRTIWLAARRRTAPEVHVRAHDMGQEAMLDVTSFDRVASGWAAYVQGVLWALRETGVPLCGWDGLLMGDVPRGAGLASSAALEMAVIRAATALVGWPWEPVEMAQVAWRAENEWVGVTCGPMDQVTAACGRDDHALLLDCRTLAVEYVPLPPDVTIVVLDTGTRRTLAESAYNERRAQCEAAAAFFGVDALRDVSPELFDRRAHELTGVVRRRARHVIAENARVLAVAEALRSGDVVRVGALMEASHASLRDDFEVSSPALDTMAAC